MSNNLPAHQGAKALSALRNSNSRFLRFIGTLFWLTSWALVILFVLLVIGFLFILVF